MLGRLFHTISRRLKKHMIEAVQGEAFKFRRRAVSTCYVLNVETSQARRKGNAS